jgi:hypothetical protein
VLAVLRAAASRIASVVARERTCRGSFRIALAGEAMRVANITSLIGI